MLYDYDVAPLITHLIVQVALKHSNSPTEFLSFFSEQNISRSSNLIRETYGESIISTYFEYQVLMTDDTTPNWERYFKNNHFLKDQMLFENVRRPFIEGNVLLINGDNNGEVFNQIADYAKEKNTQVKTLYVSNSFESRWTSEFSESLKKGLSRIPITNDSQIVLTSIDQVTHSKNRVGLVGTIKPLSISVSGGYLMIEYYIENIRLFIDAVLKLH